MKRYLLIVSLCSLAFSTTSLYAATTDFVADGDITVRDVAGTGVTADLIIKNGSRAESWTYDNTADKYFKVTNPDSTNTFKVVSVASNTSGVSSFHVNNSSGVEVACINNATPGSSYIELSSTSGTYSVYPSNTSCALSTSSSGSSGSSGVAVVTLPPMPPPPPIITPPVFVPSPAPSSLKESQLQLLTTKLKLILQLLVAQLQNQLQARLSSAALFSPPPLPLPTPSTVNPAKQLQLQLMTTQLKLLSELLRQRQVQGVIGQ